MDDLTRMEKEMEKSKKDITMDDLKDISTITGIISIFT